MPDILISEATRVTAGVLLVTIVAVESGGLFMLRIVGRRLPATPFQTASSEPDTPTPACSSRSRSRARSTWTLPRLGVSSAPCHAAA